MPLSRFLTNVACDFLLIQAVLTSQASVGPNHMGSRYARLLHMLWSKVPKRVEPRDQPRQQNIDPQLQQPQGFLPNNFNMEGLTPNSLPQNGTFRYVAWFWPHQKPKC